MGGPVSRWHIAVSPLENVKCSAGTKSVEANEQLRDDINTLVWLAPSSSVLIVRLIPLMMPQTNYTHGSAPMTQAGSNAPQRKVTDELE